MHKGLEARECIERHDSSLNAFVDLLPFESLQDGPLAGATVGVKDCFYDRGRTPTMGSRVLPPPRDTTAEVLARLRSAGADIVGYTNLHEWAIGGTSSVTATGPIRNPWNPDLVAGGSSGGSAAALAAGFVDLAVGTDTGGSIRIPAGCCGVVGLKPTQGRVPTAGYVGEGGPTDQIGPMGRDVASVRTLFECMLGEKVPAVDVARLRIGIARGSPFDNLEAEIAGPYGATLDVIARLGRATDVTFADWDTEWWANAVLFLNHTGTQVSDHLSDDPSGFDMEAMKVLRWGLSLPPGLIEAQRKVQTEARARWVALFEDVDVVITPTLPSLPPPIEHLEIRLPEDVSHADRGFGRLCGPMNLVGVPCLSVPGALVGDLAVNLSITAAAGRDDIVLAVGAAFEDATDRAFTNRTAEIRGVG